MVIPDTQCLLPEGSLASSFGQRKRERGGEEAASPRRLGGGWGGEEESVKRQRRGQLKSGPEPRQGQPSVLGGRSVLGGGEGGV